MKDKSVNDNRLKSLLIINIGGFNMTIKFNKSEKFVQKAFVASLTNSELSEEREEIVSDYVQALSDDVVTTIQNDVNTQIATMLYSYHVDSQR